MADVTLDNEGPEMDDGGCYKHIHNWHLSPPCQPQRHLVPGDKLESPKCARGLQSTPTSKRLRSPHRRVPFCMKQLPVTRKRVGSDVIADRRSDTSTFHILEMTLRNGLARGTNSAQTHLSLGATATRLSKCRRCPGGCFSTREGYI